MTDTPRTVTEAGAGRTETTCSVCGHRKHEGVCEESTRVNRVSASGWLYDTIQLCGCTGRGEK